MNVCASAIFATSSMRRRSGLSSPLAMFSAMVPENSRLLCIT